MLKETVFKDIHILQHTNSQIVRNFRLSTNGKKKKSTTKKSHLYLNTFVATIVDYVILFIDIIRNDRIYILFLLINQTVPNFQETLTGPVLGTKSRDRARPARLSLGLNGMMTVQTQSSHLGTGEKHSH